eukprot:scaffold6058_cov96-Cylindrotheca_fusiformis.AAC.4
MRNRFVSGVIGDIAGGLLDIAGKLTRMVRYDYMFDGTYATRERCSILNQEAESVASLRVHALRMQNRQKGIGNKPSNQAEKNLSTTWCQRGT